MCCHILFSESQAGTMHRQLLTCIMLENNPAKPQDRSKFGNLYTRFESISTKLIMVNNDCEIFYSTRLNS